MDAAQIESWSFGPADAAEMVNMSAVSVSNYLKRYDLFPGRPRGKGYHSTFKLRDLMKLAAVKALIESGLTPEQAAMALRGVQGPYAAMLHDGFSPLGHSPGTMVFSRNSDGRWIALDDPSTIVCIQIRAWPLFDALWPKVRAKILQEGNAVPSPYSGDVQAGINAFENRIAEIRAERWGERA